MAKIFFSKPLWLLLSHFGYSTFFQPFVGSLTAFLATDFFSLFGHILFQSFAAMLGNIIIITMQVGCSSHKGAQVALPYNMATTKDPLVEMQEKNLPKSEYDSYKCQPWCQMVDCFVLMKDEWLDTRPMTADEYPGSNQKFFFGNGV